jgi:threonine dehydratase
MVSIVCGANMNFDRLRYIAERTELGERKEAIYAVTIPEQKGAFLNFCRALQGRNITEFNYRASDDSQAQVLLELA